MSTVEQVGKTMESLDCSYAEVVAIVARLDNLAHERHVWSAQDRLRTAAKQIGHALHNLDWATTLLLEVVEEGEEEG